MISFLQFEKTGGERMRSWLKEAREARNIKMADMAQRLDISESYYCLIESGKRQQKMDITLSSRISQVLDIPLADIVSYETASH